MTVDPNHWNTAEYCEFYNSTGCNQAGIEGYICAPECLSTCPDVFCDTFSSLIYCGVGDIDQADKATMEGVCLASVSTSVPTTTVMTLSSAIAFKNVDKDSFLADAEAQEVAILTMSNFISGIPLSTVNYDITAVLEELGFDSTESEQCFDSLVNQIDQSIEYGQFEATLISNSHYVGSTFMDAVVVDEESTSVIDTVVMAVTAVPTSMPSGVPRSDDALSEGGIIAIAILVPLVVIGMVVGAYYWFVHRHKDSYAVDKKSMLGGAIGVDSSAGAKFDDL
jgi:hypothetical protein